MASQSRAAAGVQLGSLPSRLGASLVFVAGVAGVVGVLVTVLAMGQGIQKSVAVTGREDRAIVIARGSGAESNSLVSRQAALAVLAAPGIRRDARGEPLASMETMTQLLLPSRGDGAMKNVTLRGVGRDGLALRPEIHLVAGRQFRPGTHEVIAGSALQRQFRGLSIGDRIRTRNGTWTVVGTFVSPRGGLHDSELIGDADAVQSAYHRSDFQSVLVRLASPAAFDRFASAVKANKAFSLSVYREKDYFAKQYGGMGKVLGFIALFVGGIMAVGALLSAVNTMYAAISSQSRQIATMRAIGFRASSVLYAVFLEALLLAAVGAALGICLAALLFNGHSVDYLSGNNAQHVYTIEVTPLLGAVGVSWALVIGLLGGVFPAIRAARLPVAEALRIE